jgi:UDP-GlcNAc:undecaprenyl-phosphate GlcNAc-1-phosphate transferase
MAALGVTLLVFGVATSRYAPIVIWAFVLFVVGTIDDKRNLNPLIRLVIEIGAAFALWYYGLGWGILPGDALNIALTIVWVVGLVNAYNLMDNMDGAASTVAAVSAAGVALLAIVTGNIPLAIIVVALAGACTGFLPFNLARPSRIFMGDGGSMPIGFVLAAAVMVVPIDYRLGWFTLLAVVPLVGLPILDTALVVISRRRGGRPILSGGRDHLTFRLRALVGSPRAVAVCLASVQAWLCLIAVGLTQLETGWVALAATFYILAGAYVIYVLETPGSGRLAAALAARSGSTAPENSAA